MNLTNRRKRDGFQGQKLIVLPKKIINDFLRRDSITSQLHITDIGYYPKALYHYAERHTGIGQHILIYCAEGYGWVEISKKRIEVKPSEFILIPRNVPHRYGADESKPWTINWIHFKGHLADNIVELILKDSELYKPKVSHSEQRLRLFDDIFGTIELGQSHTALRYVTMTFFHFLSSLMYQSKFTSENQPMKKDVFETIIEKMKEQIHLPVSLNALAENANLSVSHFSAVFKSKTGYAPIEYFNHLKIQSACQYLSFTDMPIKTIAITLGIEDPYYFSRMFSRILGTSPTEYRLKNNNMIIKKEAK